MSILDAKHKYVYAVTEYGEIYRLFSTPELAGQFLVMLKQRSPGEHYGIEKIIIDDLSLPGGNEIGFVAKT